METTEHELDISTHDLARRSTVPHDPETGLLIISTHDLTKRSTEDGLIEVCFVDVSTHDLTKRSTLQRFHRFFSGGCFNSRPHEEVDGYPAIISLIFVSTHDLTKRSTYL